MIDIKRSMMRLQISGNPLLHFYSINELVAFAFGICNCKIKICAARTSRQVD